MNADGLYASFNHSGDLPSDTKIKLYVGDKFEDNVLVNIYHYDGNKKSLDFIKSGLNVTGGYIEFDIEHCSEYFVTMSNIGISNNSNPSSPVLFIINYKKLHIIKCVCAYL